MLSDQKAALFDSSTILRANRQVMRSGKVWWALKNLPHSNTIFPNLKILLFTSSQKGYCL